ncbi:MAG TPA: hypothetical protein VJ180_06415 [Pyrinomonadaceae bacterium]|nr:hypothetical protein [Pyrinomonadaceae bacterium]
MKTSPKLAILFQSQTALLGVQLGAGFIVIGLIFWKLQFSTDAICCGDFDGYYHIKWSRMLWDSIRSRSFPPIFTWLPHTTLNPNDYVDHHLVFHIFQIPFTWFRDLRLGAKIASVLFATLALASCYWLLLRYKIRYPLLWLLALLACSAPFLFRLNMAKAPPFAIIYLIIGIHLLFKKKHWPLLPLSFFFALTYDMFVLLILAVCLWTAVVGWAEHRFEWRPLIAVLTGIVAGMVINPYFPDNLQLLYEHLKIKITPSDFSTKVGQEWYPYNTWEFLGNSVVACIAMLAGYIAFDASERKRSHYPLFFLLFSTALMIMTARWKRIAEYWPPFAVMFSAFAVHPWLEGTRSIFTRLPAEVLEELQPFLDLERSLASAQPTNDIRDLIQTIAVAIVAVLLGLALFFNLSVTVRDIADSKSHDYYKAGSEWMRLNISSPQTVFNTDWDDFPRLFYYDPTHNYVSGLDPTYLFDKNPALSKLYDRITLGDEEDPGPLIRERFGARYVFSDNGHDKFYNNAIESGWFEVVYEDGDCTILQIRDQKGEPPPEEP